MQFANTVNPPTIMIPLRYRNNKLYRYLRFIFRNLSLLLAQQGYYFSSVAKNTSKFVKPCSKKIMEWIKSLKEGKRKVFLLTNSFIDYTNLLMDYAVG